MTYVLHYAPDNASLIIRLALEELGQPYETRLVDRSAGAQNSAAYRVINPNGLIPALETDQGPMFETGAILLWLADRHGGLLPNATAVDRGTALKWLFFVSNTLHANLRANFYPWKYIGTDKVQQAALRAGLHMQLDTQFRTLNDHWRPTGPSCAIALYIAACLRWSALYGPKDTSWFNLDRYPALRDMAAQLETRASVHSLCRAEGMGPHPFTQPMPPNPPEGSAL